MRSFEEFWQKKKINALVFFPCARGWYTHNQFIWPDWRRAHRIGFWLQPTHQVSLLLLYHQIYSIKRMLLSSHQMSSATKPIPWRHFKYLSHIIGVKTQSYQSQCRWRQNQPIRSRFTNSRADYLIISQSEVVWGKLFVLGRRFSLSGIIE